MAAISKVSKGNLLLEQPNAKTFESQLAALEKQKMQLQTQGDNSDDVARLKNMLQNEIDILKLQLANQQALGTDGLGNDLFNTREVGGTPFPTDRGSNAENANAWFWAVLNRCGVALFPLDGNSIEHHVEFQHQDRMPFSPFTTELGTPDNAMLLLLLLKGMHPDNFKALTVLLASYMQNVARTVEAVAEFGNTNWANHTSATMLLSSILHRLGLIDDAGYVRTQEHARSIFDKMWEKDIALGALGGVTTLVNGAKVSSGQGEQGTGQSSAGIAAAAKLLAGAI